MNEKRNDTNDYAKQAYVVCVWAGLLFCFSAICGGLSFMLLFFSVFFLLFVYGCIIMCIVV